MADKDADKPAKPRLRRVWSRKPTQKPHSTKKGAKGYKRSDAKRAQRDEAEPDQGT
jgi:hypothetical protein